MKSQAEKFKFMLSLFLVLTVASFFAAGLAVAAECNGEKCTIECIGPEPCDGTDESDVICGDSNGQTIFAHDGDDVICAGDGYDIIYGGSGSDEIAGEGGNDTIWGEDGNDAISGGPGDDWLSGDKGFDVVIGQKGNDECRSEVTFQCE